MPLREIPPTNYGTPRRHGTKHAPSCTCKQCVVEVLTAYKLAAKSRSYAGLEKTGFEKATITAGDGNVLERDVVTSELYIIARDEMLRRAETELLAKLIFTEPSTCTAFFDFCAAHINEPISSTTISSTKNEVEA